MKTGEEKIKTTTILRLLSILSNLPWLEIVIDCWKFGRKVLRGLASEGIYETNQYESTLELKNKRGTKASFEKKKRIRYLQDGIIAYQDHAWGDGQILLNYQTNRGKAVDRYRAGYKTHILLSLREVKNKGDIDEFNIQWDIHNGFLTDDGYWSTDINQRTKHVKVNVIFPKSRPPLRLMIEESNRKRTRMLSNDAKIRLPDGRWRVTWETSKPRLYEVYVLRWIW